MNRDFKGIWIPREIWLSNFSCQEKCLWAEIHSLFDREKGGCFASNEYLSEFLGVKERRLQEMLSNLKYQGWLVQVSFDGRNRVIRAIVPAENISPDDGAGQRCGKAHPCGAEKCTPDMQDSAPPSYIIDTSVDIRLDNTHTPPAQDAPSATHEKSAASAACVGGLISETQKPSRKKPEFSPKVKEVASQMLDLLAKHSPVYRPPADMTKFFTHVQEILEKDKQETEVVIATFEWAVSDNEQRGDFKGWQSIIATNSKGSKSTTPAEIFRKHFTKLYSQMKSQPKRKFAPSSDMERAHKAMQEMNERAL